MDMKSMIEDICECQKTIFTCFKSAIDSGVMNVDTKEAGEVADIIKDLAETEKNLREAKYYELVSKAMEEETESYGYTPRYKPMVDQKPYTDAYIRDPNRFRSDMRMGYDEEPSRYGMEYDRYSTAKRYYTEGDMSKKTEMATHSKKYMTEAMENMKDMWDNADPQTKVQMREDFKALVKYFE